MSPVCVTPATPRYLEPLGSLRRVFLSRSPAASQDIHDAVPSNLMAAGSPDPTMFLAITLMALPRNQQQVRG
jgi:hypothetical protein